MAHLGSEVPPGGVSERMIPVRPGDVTLNWAQKGKTVLRDPVTGEWRYCEDMPLPQVLLETVEVVRAEGENPVDAANLIVQGDCYLACLALLPSYEGQVSLVYADPPFNTGNTSLSYDDNLTRPAWLSFIRDRLAVAKRLLRPGGICAVHIGVSGHPYLRLIMDEVFGLGNLVTQISWQRAPDRTVLGQGSTIVNDCLEYILVYSNGPARRDLPRPVKEEPISWKTLRTYGRTMDISPEKDLVREFTSSSGRPVRIYRHREFSLKPIPVGDLKHAYLTSWNRLRHDFPRMARLTNQQQESTFQQALLSQMPLADTLYAAEYVETRGKHKGHRVRYYLNKQIVLFLSDVAAYRGDRVVRVSDMNNLWTHDEIPVTGIAREGGVTLKRGKKPEALLHRIISAFSLEGELVLDPFAGSGTTAAVAHKTGRRWIMIDDSAAAALLMRQRMTAVVAGTDLRGVTRLAAWKGGGGFTVMRLAKV